MCGRESSAAHPHPTNPLTGRMGRKNFFLPVVRLYIQPPGKHLSVFKLLSTKPILEQQLQEGATAPKLQVHINAHIPASVRKAGTDGAKFERNVVWEGKTGIGGFATEGKNTSRMTAECKAFLKRMIVIDVNALPALLKAAAGAQRH